MLKKVLLVSAFFISAIAAYRLFDPQPPASNRDPAAFQRGLDVSSLKGAPLFEAVKEKLVTGFELQKDESLLKLSLGHFYFENLNGQPVSACQSFKTVIYRFEAEGSSVGGELPTMEVEGPCLISTDNTKLETLDIPYSDIFLTPPGDGEFEFKNSRPIVIRFSNISDEWPKTWVMKSVQMVSPEQPRVYISKEEMTKFLGRSIVVQF